MLIPLPNLDDRRWPDLVDESRSLIPVLAPEWTDHNASDPGQTLIELYAWVTEMDVYQANQVTAAARRRFLSLLGIEPWPPRPAATVIAIRLAPGKNSVDLPTGSELDTVAGDGVVTRFRTVDPLTAVDGELRAIYVMTGHALVDRSARAPGEVLAAWGDDPAAGTTLYLGFTRPFPTGTQTTVYATVAGGRSDAEARRRLLDELIPDPGCEPVDLPCDCVDGVVAWPRVPANEPVTTPTEPLRHHDVQLAWEVRTTTGDWVRLDDGGGVIDETRSLTLDGRVLLRPPAPMASGAEDGMDDGLWYVRCRLVAGAWDRAPALVQLTLNGVASVQAARPGTEMPAMGTGRAWQRVVLADRPVVAHSLVVETTEAARIRRWDQRADFDASSGDDAHVVLDSVDGTLRFGDGERGRTVPAGAAIHVAYLATRAEAGNLAAGCAFTLASGDRNPTLGEDDREAVMAATNVVAAAGGAPAETLEHAEGRAWDVLERVTRAVTLTDIETLALATPGTAVARAAAFAGLFPTMPCVDAAGMVTVVVVPWLPAGRPMPSDGLLRAVRRYLGRRRLIGTRIEVVAPTYLEVSVRATVAMDPGMAREAVRSAIEAAVHRFFHPLEGGPDGRGWPLGRDVYRTEVLDVINRVPGVARVEALELVAAGCDTCSNVCIGRTGLVASGRHAISVEPAR